MPTSYTLKPDGINLFASVRPAHSCVFIMLQLIDQNSAKHFRWSVPNTCKRFLKTVPMLLIRSEHTNVRI